MIRLLRDASVSAVAAGFVTVLVGFASSAVLVIQAAQGLGASDAEIASWLWALGLGMGATCIGLSLRYRVPVVTAWSTPGAAMLITGAAGVSMPEAVGAFLVSALLLAASGFSGWLERAMNRVPMSIAAGMLAGVLLRFGLDVFVAMGDRFGLAFAMLLGYLAGRRFAPRYAVILALLLGTAVAAAQGLLHLGDLGVALATPVFTAPRFSPGAIIGIALPLFVVTTASQNAAGIAVMRASGYRDVPVSPLVGWAGAATFVLAPFGAFALNLAAITAAITMGREAHEDPARRYVAAVSAGAFYLIVGLFGATVVAAFAALPKELVMAIAGLALFGTIGNALAGALADEREREPALIAFLMTASGVSLAGIGAPFWGLLAGVLAALALRVGRA